MLNQLPEHNSISEDRISPTLVVGALSPDYNTIKQLNFGDYVLAHTARSRTNDNNPRSVEFILLYSTGNAQGSWVLSGRRIQRYQWDVIPMTQEIVNRVNELA